MTRTKFWVCLYIFVPEYVSVYMCMGVYHSTSVGKTRPWGPGPTVGVSVHICVWIYVCIYVYQSTWLLLKWTARTRTKQYLWLIYVEKCHYIYIKQIVTPQWPNPQHICFISLQSSWLWNSLLYFNAIFVKCIYKIFTVSALKNMFQWYSFFHVLLEFSIIKYIYPFWMICCVKIKPYVWMTV